MTAPPIGADLLPGITRGKLLQAATATGVPVREQHLRKADLLAADEVFLSSTTAEVVSVVVVDGQSIGTGKPGPVAARIYAKFVELFARG